MAKTVNVEKIVNEMEAKEDLCFTRSERLLLEIAVLKGSIATLDIQREEIKELAILKAKHELRIKPKQHWFKQLFKGIKK